MTIRYDIPSQLTCCESGYDIRTVQELPGKGRNDYHDLSHVLNRGGKGFLVRLIHS